MLLRQFARSLAVRSAAGTLCRRSQPECVTGQFSGCLSAGWRALSNSADDPSTASFSGQPPAEFAGRCFRCGEIGHTAAQCSKELMEQVCFKCGQPGHIARNCPNVQMRGQQQSSQQIRCYNCNQVGHMARDCPNPTICKNCGQPGHFARECTASGVGRGVKICYRCGKPGHIAAFCPEHLNK